MSDDHIGVWDDSGIQETYDEYMRRVNYDDDDDDNFLRAEEKQNRELLETELYRELTDDIIYNLKRTMREELIKELNLKEKCFYDEFYKENGLDPKDCSSNKFETTGNFIGELGLEINDLLISEVARELAEELYNYNYFKEKEKEDIKKRFKQDHLDYFKKNFKEAVLYELKELENKSDSDEPTFDPPF